MSKPKPFPGPAEFFVEGSLYVPYVLDQQKKPTDNQLLESFKGPLDCHCVGCGRTSVFHLRSRYSGEDGYYFRCSRSEDHELAFHYNIWSEGPDVHPDELLKELASVEVGKPLPPRPPRTHYAMKIGQWPTLADLASERIGRYRLVLSEKQYRELNKGVGLHAHDVGIGSFVYLRRVFEALVEEAHAKAKVEGGWDEELFQRSRMEEKIKLLPSHLPRTLVENRGVYSILSLGIHELEEEQCAALFPVVRNGIEMILDEKIAERERATKEMETKKAIEEATARLGGKPG